MMIPPGVVGIRKRVKNEIEKTQTPPSERMFLMDVDDAFDELVGKLTWFVRKVEVESKEPLCEVREAKELLRLLEK